MKINKKSLCDNNSSSSQNTTSGSKSGCGCGTKHGAATEYEVEETDIEVSK